MLRKCVDSNMLHAGWAARDWQPRSLLKRCVVNITVGQGSTAACQAGAGVAPVEPPERCRFGQAETGRHAAAHAGVYAGPVLLQEPCW